MARCSKVIKNRLYISYVIYVLLKCYWKGESLFEVANWNWWKTLHNNIIMFWPIEAKNFMKMNKIIYSFSLNSLFFSTMLSSALILSCKMKWKIEWILNRHGIRIWVLIIEDSDYTLCVQRMWNWYILIECKL